MDIQPIRTDNDHAAALVEIERLWGADHGTGAGDKLDILVTLVEAYEDTRWPVSHLDPIDVLEFAMAEMGHRQAELGRLIGRSRASEILGRKRPLTLQMMQILNKEWRIPAELLIRPYNLRSEDDHDTVRNDPRSRTKRQSSRPGRLQKPPRRSGGQR